MALDYNELNDFNSLPQREQAKVLTHYKGSRPYLLDFYNLPEKEKIGVLKKLEGQVAVAEPAQPGRYGAAIEPQFPQEEPREPFTAKLRKAYDPRLQFGAMKQVMGETPEQSLEKMLFEDETVPGAVLRAYNLPYKYAGEVIKAPHRAVKATVAALQKYGEQEQPAAASMTRPLHAMATAGKAFWGGLSGQKEVSGNDIVKNLGIPTPEENPRLYTENPAAAYGAALLSQWYEFSTDPLVWHLLGHYNRLAYTSRAAKSLMGTMEKSEQLNRYIYDKMKIGRTDWGGVTWQDDAGNFVTGTAKELHRDMTKHLVKGFRQKNISIGEARNIIKNNKLFLKGIHRPATEKFLALDMEKQLAVATEVGGVPAITAPPTPAIPLGAEAGKIVLPPGTEPIAPPDIAEPTGYKNAETFIKAHGKPIFHGTAAQFEQFDISKAGTIQRADWGKGIYFDVSKSGARYYRDEAVAATDEAANKAYEKLRKIEKTLKPKSVGKDGTIYDSTPAYTEEYHRAREEWLKLREKAVKDKTKGRVVEAYIDRNAKVYRHIYEPGMITDSFLGDRLRSEGYDVLEIWDRDRETGEQWISEVVVLNPEVIKTKEELEQIYSLSTEKLKVDYKVKPTAPAQVAPETTEEINKLQRRTLSSWTPEGGSQDIDIGAQSYRVYDILKEKGMADKSMAIDLDRFREATKAPEKTDKDAWRAFIDRELLAPWFEVVNKAAAKHGITPQFPSGDNVNGYGMKFGDFVDYVTEIAEGARELSTNPAIAETGVKEFTITVGYSSNPKTAENAVDLAKQTKNRRSLIIAEDAVAEVREYLEKNPAALDKLKDLGYSVLEVQNEKLVGLELGGAEVREEAEAVLGGRKPGERDTAGETGLARRKEEPSGAKKPEVKPTVEEPKEIPKGVEISDVDIYDSHRGESYGKITAWDSKGDWVGHVQFSEYNDDVAIQWIEVKPELRRKGIATALRNKLAQEYPDAKIEALGSFLTKEGYEFEKGVKPTKPAPKGKDIVTEPKVDTAKLTKRRDKLTKRRDELYEEAQDIAKEEGGKISRIPRAYHTKEHRALWRRQSERDLIENYILTEDTKIGREYLRVTNEIDTINEELERTVSAPTEKEIAAEYGARQKGITKRTPEVPKEQIRERAPQGNREAFNQWRAVQKGEAQEMGAAGTPPPEEGKTFEDQIIKDWNKIYKRKKLEYQRVRREARKRLYRQLKAKRSTTEGLKKDILAYAKEHLTKPDYDKIRLWADRVKTKYGVAKAIIRMDHMEDKYTKHLIIDDIKKLVDNKHLQQLRPEFRKLVDNVISDIDLTKPRPKTVEGLRELVRHIARNPDNNIPQWKVDQIQRLLKTPISDYTANDLEDVRDALVGYINQNRLKNQLIIKGKLRNFDNARDMATITIKRIDPAKTDPRKAIEVSKMKQLFTTWQVNAEHISMGVLDGGRNGINKQIIYDGVDNGTTEYYRFMQESDDFFQARFKDIKMDNWSEAFHPRKDWGRKVKYETFKLDNGKTIRMTPGEKITLYLDLQNENNLRRVLNGGYHPRGNKDYLYNFTLEDFEQIIKSMTPAEKKVAGAIYEYFNKNQKEAIDKVAVRLNMQPIAIEPDYFPMSNRLYSGDIKRNYLLKTNELPQDMRPFTQTTLEGMGMFKERVPNNRPLILDDAFAVVYRSMKQSAAYIGYAEPLRNAKALIFDDEYRKAINTRWGSHVWQELADYIRDIEGEYQRVDKVEQVVTHLINRLDVAVLGANLWVMALQPISYTAAGTELATKHFLHGLKSNPAPVKLMSKWSPQLRNRYEARAINREMGEVGQIGQVRQYFLEKATLGQKMMGGLLKGDWVAVGKIWRAAEAEISEFRPNLEGDDRMRAIAKRTEEIVRLSQPTFHLKDRSRIMRSRNTWVRLATKYSSQRNKNYMMLYRATNDYNNSKHAAGDKTKLLKRYALIMLVQPLLIMARDEIRRRAQNRKLPERVLRNQLIKYLNVQAGNVMFIAPMMRSLTSYIERGEFGGYDISDILSSQVEVGLKGIAGLVRAVDQAVSKEVYESGTKEGQAKWKNSMIRAIDRLLSFSLRLQGIPYDTIKSYLRIPIETRKRLIKREGQKTTGTAGTQKDIQEALKKQL